MGRYVFYKDAVADRITNEFDVSVKCDIIESVCPEIIATMSEARRIMRIDVSIIGIPIDRIQRFFDMENRECPIVDETMNFQTV